MESKEVEFLRMSSPLFLLASISSIKGLNGSFDFPEEALFAGIEDAFLF